MTKKRAATKKGSKKRAKKEPKGKSPDKEREGENERPLGGGGGQVRIGEDFFRVGGIGLPGPPEIP